MRAYLQIEPKGCPREIVLHHTSVGIFVCLTILYCHNHVSPALA